MRSTRIRPTGRFVLGITLMCVTLSACGSDEGQSTTTQPDSESSTTAESAPLTTVELLVPFPPSILRPGLIMAEDRFFEEEGLDVQITTVDGSSVVAQQLIAENATIGLLDTASILIANGDGHPLRSIASFNHDVFDIVVPVESEVTSVADLEGRTLGVTDLSGGEMNLVRAVLADAGLSVEDDLEIVAVGDGGPASFLALQDGTIDAFAGAINDFVALELEGLSSTSIVPEEYTNLPAGNFVVLQSTLDDPELRSIVMRVVRARIKGLAFTQDQVDEALEVACAALPEQCEDMDRARSTMVRGLEINVPAEGDPWGINDHDGWRTTQETLLADVLESEVDVTVTAPNDLIPDINDF